METYEKFEDWMIGKRVKHLCTGYVGEIVSDRGADVVVDWDHHGAMGALVSNLEFLEETKEESIQWEVGQEVWCLLRGKGVVSCVDNADDSWTTGVTVRFEGHGNVRYHLDGKVSGGMNRCLFFSEPKIIADKLPPKKKFVPVLKLNDGVIASAYEPSIQMIPIWVKEETEDAVIAYDVTIKGEKLTIYHKDKYSFHKIGEKVEFNV